MEKTQLDSNKTVILSETPSQTRMFHDLYPERKGKAINYSLGQKISGKDNEHMLKRLCEEHVIQCITSMPLVKTMLGALEAQGCPVDLERHIACDACDPNVKKSLFNCGDYDDQNNQVFICANRASNFGEVHGALVRNLISMFDRCVGKVDYRNVDHLACTEVRKATLANCNFLVYMTRKDANFAVKNEHRECARKTAIQSLVETKYVDKDLAEAAVNRVFEKCYNDQEPIGRKSKDQGDMKRAFEERYLFGYK